MMEVLEFPLSAELEYVAEGAANVVFRFTLPPPSPIADETNSDSDWDDGRTTPPPSEIPALHYDPIFNHKLLRLRKLVPSGSSVLES